MMRMHCVYQNLTLITLTSLIAQIAGFFWDFGSRANMVISGDVERTFEEDEERAGGFKRLVKRRQTFRAAMAVIIATAYSRARWHSNVLTATR